ncbi:hypothetical protein GQ55_7G292800 [Panicum hallii var. hallii]|uniref:Uncharacterized protein n=1 Tax=Panicum hallii var. hallii TaxID=1504633 RepID=A0A2T7D0B6_9POAL|nr:hypothetical protein GQ55_7G292800 [Panicum hallii var. hallii]
MSQTCFAVEPLVPRLMKEDAVVMSRQWSCYTTRPFTKSRTHGASHIHTVVSSQSLLLARSNGAPLVDLLEEVYAAALLQVLGQQLPVGAHGHLAADVERVPVPVAPERQPRADPRPHPHRHLHPAVALRRVLGHVLAGRHLHALELQRRRGLGRLVQRRRRQGAVPGHVGAAVLHRQVEPVEEVGDVPVRVADGELPLKHHRPDAGRDAGRREGRHVEPRPVRADGEVGDEDDDAGDEEEREERRAQQLGAPRQVRPLHRQRPDAAGGEARRRGRFRRHGGYWPFCCGFGRFLFHVVIP